MYVTDKTFKLRVGLSDLQYFLAKVNHNKQNMCATDQHLLELKQN